jgi:small subunit ribosomal protein S18
MAIDEMAKQASAGESEVKFLTPLDITTKSEKKYCRFKKFGIKHVDYKDADFLLQFVNEQGKILPRRYTGTSLKYQKKFLQLSKELDT